MATPLPTPNFSILPFNPDWKESLFTSKFTARSFVKNAHNMRALLQKNARNLEKKTSKAHTFAKNAHNLEKKTSKKAFTARS